MPLLNTLIYKMVPPDSLRLCNLYLHGHVTYNDALHGTGAYVRCLAGWHLLRRASNDESILSGLRCCIQPFTTHESLAASYATLHTTTYFKSHTMMRHSSDRSNVHVLLNRQNIYIFRKLVRYATSPRSWYTWVPHHPEVSSICVTKSANPMFNITRSVPMGTYVISWSGTLISQVLQ
jgi:hypothetical protein